MILRARQAQDSSQIVEGMKEEVQSEQQRCAQLEEAVDDAFKVLQNVWSRCFDERSPKPFQPIALTKTICRAKSAMEQLQTKLAPQFQAYKERICTAAQTETGTADKMVTVQAWLAGGGCA